MSEGISTPTWIQSWLAIGEVGRRALVPMSAEDLDEIEAALKEAIASGLVRCQTECGKDVRDAAEVNLYRRGYLLHRSDFLAWLNGHQPEALRPGRKPKPEWDKFWAQVCIHIHHNGLPESQSEMSRLMRNWCRENLGWEPQDSQVREKLRPVFKGIFG